MAAMAQRFFELNDDVNVPGRWHLTNPVDGEGREVEDPWRFRRGVPVEAPEGLRVPIQHAGRALDFTLAGLSIPVIHSTVATVFAELAPRDVQLIPVQLEGVADAYFILVATRLIRCIDEKASRVQYWTPEDGLPHKVGQYYAVDDLHIDKARAGDAKLFRLEGWAGTLIISEDLKDALERIRATGTRFTEV